MNIDDQLRGLLTSFGLSAHHKSFNRVLSAYDALARDIARQRDCEAARKALPNGISNAVEQLGVCRKTVYNRAKAKV